MKKLDFFHMHQNLEACGSALESRGDSAFNALGLVQKFALSVKCDAKAHAKAKKCNHIFDFRKFIIIVFSIGFV